MGPMGTQVIQKGPPGRQNNEQRCSRWALLEPPGAPEASNGTEGFVFCPFLYILGPLFVAPEFLCIDLGFHF